MKFLAYDTPEEKINCMNAVKDQKIIVDYDTPTCLASIKKNSDSDKAVSMLIIGNT